MGKILKRHQYAGENKSFGLKQHTGLRESKHPLTHLFNFIYTIKIKLCSSDTFQFSDFSSHDFKKYIEIILFFIFLNSSYLNLQK